MQVLDDDLPGRGDFNGVRDYLTQQAVHNPVPLPVKEAFLNHVRCTL